LVSIKTILIPNLFFSYHGKAIQNWWDWDGFGPYKSRPHDYPNNVTLRDFQRRRIFKKFAEDRLRINSIFKNEILPKVS
jgi:hypothetical protein